MPRFKPYSYEQMLMIPVDLKSQLQPGTFEFALNEIVGEMDLSVFDGRFRNDETGAPADRVSALQKGFSTDSLDRRKEMATPQWIDVSKLSFSVLMLLEHPHLMWFPRNWPGNELGIALKYNKPVYDYFCLKAPDSRTWLNDLVEQAGDCRQSTVRQCEIAVMKRICDWIVYVYCPEEYDKQPFLKWNNDELLCLADFDGKVIADIGSGTGRLLEQVVAAAKTVYAVEPIERLRRFLRSKFSAHRGKFLVLDGLITDIPLSDKVCDLVLAGHVYGDAPEAELRELERIAKAGGMVILCPGNSDLDNDGHRILVARGYQWSTFHEPVDGAKRKYWKTV